MAFKVEKVTATSDSVVLGERLWLDADGEVVADGDETAATLLGVEGDELTVERAEALGLVKGAGGAKTKQRARAEDKAAGDE